LVEIDIIKNVKKYPTLLQKSLPVNSLLKNLKIAMISLSYDVNDHVYSIKIRVIL